MSDKLGRKVRCACGSGKKFKHCCFVKTQVQPSPIAVEMDKPVQGGTPENPTLPPPELYRIAKAVGFKDGETWSLRIVADRVDALVERLAIAVAVAELPCEVGPWPLLGHKTCIEATRAGDHLANEWCHPCTLRAITMEKVAHSMREVE